MTLTASLREQQDVAQQTLVESSLLRHLMEGLRLAVAWRTQTDDCSRKLATLRFITCSFRRHLERLMKLEEVDGYMDIILETKPFLIGQVDALKQDHEAFRRDAASIEFRLGRASETDPEQLDRIGADLTAILDRLDRHHRREAKVFQEAFKQEEGGEG